jgi:hypothetical protein
MPGAGWAQIANNVFPATVHAPNQAPFKSLGLFRWVRFEWFRVRPEPDLDNAIAARPVMDAARNGLHFGKFRHFLIV